MRDATCVELGHVRNGGAMTNSERNTLFDIALDIHKAIGDDDDIIRAEVAVQLYKLYHVIGDSANELKPDLITQIYRLRETLTTDFEHVESLSVGQQIDVLGVMLAIKKAKEDV